MKKRPYSFWLILFIITAQAICMFSGCKKPEQQQEEEQKRSFSYESEDSEVSLDQTGLQSSRNAVHADFNADGLEDYAIIDDASGKQVAIYIRKAIPDSPGADPIYYQAGKIRRSLNGNIIGLMSRKGPKYTDLIVLVSHEDGPNEMIHYRNDGKSFTEIQ